MKKVNKNGFTLIELVVTIGLMALIGIVISVNVLGMFSDQEDQDYEAFKKQIEDAACIYVETTNDLKKNCRATNGCYIAIDKTIGEGYIAEDLVDPSTGKKVSENPSKYKVRVSWVDNEKQCKMEG